MPTVKELKEKLADLDDDDLVVILDGCDCRGAWNGATDIIEINGWNDERSVVLLRDD